jgi:hypothetical protein
MTAATPNGSGMTHPTVSEAMPVIIDHRLSWLMGAAGVVGAVLVAGAVFLGVVMASVYERMLGVCFEGQTKDRDPCEAR